MFALRFLATFETEVVSWQRTLASITEVSSLLSEVQRTWAFLENLFIYSEEVKKELPEDSDNFVNVDHDVKQLLRRGAEVRLVRPFCCEPGIFEALEKAQAQLQVCEKALNEFMDGRLGPGKVWGGRYGEESKAISERAHLVKLVAAGEFRPRDVAGWLDSLAREYDKGALAMAGGLSDYP
ncbi:unnamed protein product [Prorocentrum cordatum]|uniref:Dynein heavy chain linker domain-containing protein n=1 Tax=Prorocentrum cordatum TaxID=2364126 RepID=A0ABN9XBL6_9DINO|nr:unnamed protein product [Polarella glacialis]